MSSTNSEMLDLVDIALLLTYERATTEPRFHNTKLRDIAFPGERPTFTSNLYSDDWIDNARTYLLFDKQPESYNEPDLPSNMLPPENERSEKLRSLTSKQIETIFYRARGHDFGFTSIALLQHFFDLYDPFTQLRVRHIGKGKEPGHFYVTRINRRHIREDVFVSPKISTISLVPGNGQHYSQYAAGVVKTMPHPVFAFAPLDADNPTSFLDLSSLQFGDIGRGPGEKGKGLFALDTWEEFITRLPKIAEGNDGNVTKTSARVGPAPQYDEWLKEVARRAKERWDKRDEERWCGHCGGPVPEASKCSKCKKAWFCSREHMELAWPFHKGYCRQN